MNGGMIYLLGSVIEKSIISYTLTFWKWPILNDLTKPDLEMTDLKWFDQTWFGKDSSLNDLIKTDLKMTDL